MEIKAITPPTVGWLEGKLPENAVKYLWKCIEKKKGSEKKNLAGNIEGSYQLIDEDDWFFHNVVYPFLSEYNKEFYNLGNALPINARHPYFLQKLWVNYQKENEFNPLHDHTGIYSFVIWMKIPTNWKDQFKLPFLKGIKGGDKRPSSFEFAIPCRDGGLVTPHYKMSADWEGHMLFFPARMFHQVYPFYDCDEERISISGNIGLDTTKT